MTCLYFCIRNNKNSLIIFMKKRNTEFFFFSHLNNEVMKLQKSASKLTWLVTFVCGRRLIEQI